MVVTCSPSPERTEDHDLADGEHNEREDDERSTAVNVSQQGGTDGAPDHDAAAVDHIEREPVKHGAVNRQSVWLRNGLIEPKTSPYSFGFGDRPVG